MPWPAAGRSAAAPETPTKSAAKPPKLGTPAKGKWNDPYRNDSPKIPARPKAVESESKSNDPYYVQDAELWARLKSQAMSSTGRLYPKPAKSDSEQRKESEQEQEQEIRVEQPLLEDIATEQTDDAADRQAKDTAFGQEDSEWFGTEEEVAFVPVGKQKLGIEGEEEQNLQQEYEQASEPVDDSESNSVCIVETTEDLVHDEQDQTQRRHTYESVLQKLHRRDSVTEQMESISNAVDFVVRASPAAEISQLGQMYRKQAVRRASDLSTGCRIWKSDLHGVDGDFDRLFTVLQQPTKGHVRFADNASSGGSRSESGKVLVAHAQRALDKVQDCMGGIIEQVPKIEDPDSDRRTLQAARNDAVKYHTSASAAIGNLMDLTEPLSEMWSIKCKDGPHYESHKQVLKVKEQSIASGAVLPKGHWQLGPIDPDAARKNVAAEERTRHTDEASRPKQRSRPPKLDNPRRHSQLASEKGPKQPQPLPKIPSIASHDLHVRRRPPKLAPSPIIKPPEGRSEQELASRSPQPLPRRRPPKLPPKVSQQGPEKRLPQQLSKSPTDNSQRRLLKMPPGGGRLVDQYSLIGLLQYPRKPPKLELRRPPQPVSKSDSGITQQATRKDSGFPSPRRPPKLGSKRQPPNRPTKTVKEDPS